MVQSTEYRTAEQGTAEYRSEKYCFTALKTSADRNSLFDISAVQMGGSSDIVNFDCFAIAFWIMITFSLM